MEAGLSFFDSGTRRVGVWLDVGKTRDELKLARLTHRCHEVMSEVESETADAQAVLKCLRGKFVSIGIPARRIGYSLQGEWRWTTLALSRYKKEDLDMALAFIDGN